ncbi:AKIP1 protein, partial [Brachypodius atriceps]|nr:AKIP1 protein [Brachypodius atriceps]
TSHMIFSVSVAVQKYYGATATNMCKENEIQHFCKYHGKSVERKMHSTEGKVSSFGGFFCFFGFFVLKPRRSSKDFYIEVSPGTYSVTAISEDMVEQTHVIDVNAGQTVDVTFVL